NCLRPSIDLLRLDIATFIEIDCADVGVLEAKADAVHFAGKHGRNSIAAAAPGFRIVSRSVLPGVACDVGRLRPFTVLAAFPTPRYPTVLSAQACQCPWWAGEISAESFRLFRHWTKERGRTLGTAPVLQRGLSSKLSS